MLGFCEMQNTLSLGLLSGPLWSEIAASDKGPIYGFELFELEMFDKTEIA